MPCVYYISNGFTQETEKIGEYFGFTELRLWNPMKWDTKIQMTVYYTDKEPALIPVFNLESGATPLLVFTRDYTEYFKECGHWGLKIVSNTPVIIDHIFLAGRKGPPDNVKYAGGCNDSLAKDGLSRLWYFGDGLALVWDPETAPFPNNQFEWYHILNPNRQDAHVTMKCYYSDKTLENYDYTVGAERVFFIDNYGMVKTNNSFGIRFVSDVPVVVESERFIYGLRGGFAEWGAHVHCPRPGIPAPLAWNEEDVVENEVDA